MFDGSDVSDGAEFSESYSAAKLFGFDIHHGVVESLMKRFPVLFAEAEFNPNMRGNLHALFRNGATLEAFNRVPGLMDRLAGIGIGDQTHDSRGPDPSHSAYTEWQAAQFADLGRAGTLHQRVAGFWDVVRYVNMISDGKIYVDGQKQAVATVFHGASFRWFFRSRTMALRIVRSFLAQAVRTSLRGFPASWRRARKAFMAGSYRLAMKAAM